MIVYRTYSVIKPGKMEEAIAWRKKMAEASKPRRARFYTPMTGGLYRTLCVEIEFEDLIDFQTWWADAEKKGLSAEIEKSWTPMTDYGGHSEFWSLV